MLLKRSVNYITGIHNQVENIIQSSYFPDKLSYLLNSLIDRELVNSFVGKHIDIHVCEACLSCVGGIDVS